MNISCHGLGMILFLRDTRRMQFVISMHDNIRKQALHNKSLVSIRVGFFKQKLKIYFAD